jgi:hypothetical protein
MKYAVKMDSGATIHKPIFINIGSDFQKLMGGGRGLTGTQQGVRISLILFFQQKESRLKI